jgi:hypothetical protein
LSQFGFTITSPAFSTTSPSQEMNLMIYGFTITGTNAKFILLMVASINGGKTAFLMTCLNDLVNLTFLFASLGVTCPYWANCHFTGFIGCNPNVRNLYCPLISTSAPLFSSSL